MGAAERLRLNREALKTKLTARAAATTALEQLRGADPATITDQQVTDAMAARAAIDAEIDALEAAASELRAEIARDEAMERLASETIPGSGAVPNQRTSPADPSQERSPAVVTSEPRTYTNRTNTYDKVSFFADAWQARTGEGSDPYGARERLERHAREVSVEREAQTDRASTTGTFGSLIVPQYLVDMVAPLLRAGRPVANICNRHELPSRGMSLIIPRVTTGTSVQAQASQNTPISPLTDPAVTDLTVPVVTIAGGVDVSRQALERGDNVDVMLYGDLARAHAVSVDSQVISGPGTGGTMLGMLNTAGISQAAAYTAAATAGTFNVRIAGQIAAVSSQGAGLYPKLIVVHPRRWAWLTAQVDTTGRPIVTANTLGNFNAGAIITKPGQISADSDPINGVQFVGLHSSGLPILTDLNVPTAVGTGPEDVAIVGDNTEWHLWEEGNGMPRELKFDQTLGGQLTTKLLVYSYNAFTAGRYPGATGVTGGNSAATNGQIAPTFVTAP